MKATLSPTDKLRNAVHFLSKIMHPDKTKLTLHEDVWLEALDPKHRHCDALRLAHEQWRDLKDPLPFFQWVDNNPEKHIKVIESNIKFKDFPQARFISSTETNPFEVTVNKDKLLKRNGTLVDTQHSLGKDARTRGHQVCVVNLKGKISIHEYKKGKLHHVCTSRGLPLTLAGMIEVKAGKVSSFILDSGHYKPSEKHLDVAIDFLSSISNIREIKIQAPYICKEYLKSRQEVYQFQL